MYVTVTPIKLGWVNPHIQGQMVSMEVMWVTSKAGFVILSNIAVTKYL